MIGWETEGFALASGYDQTTTRYEGLVLPGGDNRFGQITNSTLLVRPDTAIRQRQTDTDAAAAVAVPARRGSQDTETPARAVPAETTSGLSRSGPTRSSPERQLPGAIATQYTLRSSAVPEDGRHIPQPTTLTQRAPYP
jgi:hypothetical protein